MSPPTQPPDDHLTKNAPQPGRALAGRLGAMGIRVALVVASSLLVLIPAELVMRRLVRLQPPMAESDPVTVYRLRPDLIVRDTSPGDFSVVYHTSSAGLRGEEIVLPKPPGKWRLLGVGDSFTFGIGVADDETYLAQLETLLTDDPPNDHAAGAAVEVVNAGTAGWGTGHALAYLEDRGLALEPDALLLGFFANDPLDDLSSRLFELVEGELMATPSEARQEYFPERRWITRLPFYETLAHNSALLALLRTHYMSWRVRHRAAPGDATGSPAKTSSEPPRPSIEHPPLELTRHLFRRLGRLAEQHRLPLVVLLIPRPWTSEQTPEEILARYRDHRQLCVDEGIDCLDATPWLLASGASPEQLYFQHHDHHWTPLAHRLAARGLAEHLRSWRAGPAPPPTSLAVDETTAPPPAETIP